MKNYILILLFVICIGYTCQAQTDSVKLYVESNVNYLRYWGKLQFTPKGDSMRRILVPNFSIDDFSLQKLPYLLDYLQKYKNDSIPKVRQFVSNRTEYMVKDRRITMDFRKKIIKVYWEYYQPYYFMCGYPLSYFDDWLKDSLRVRLQKKNPSEDLIKLVGYLQLKDQMPRLREIVKNKEFSSDYASYGIDLYEGMDARFALARMGDEEQIKYILDIAYKNYASIFQGQGDLDSLMYIKLPQIVTYLEWVMTKKDKLVGIHFGNKYPISVMAREYLGQIIKDFPYIYASEVPEKKMANVPEKEMVRLSQEWLKKNRNTYQIAYDLFGKK